MYIQKHYWGGRFNEERLGGYVYVLVDPRDSKNEIFYIGKGGGISGKGNDRAEAHLDETRKALASNRPLTAKQQRIADINSANQQVELIIVRRNVDSETAKHVEAALIDLLSTNSKIGLLTNKVRGSDIAEHAIVTKENCMEVMPVNVCPLQPIDNVWLFNIKKELERGIKTPAEATMGSWKIADKVVQAEQNKKSYAVGLANGIARVVIEINRWKKSELHKGKYDFEGDVVNDSIVGRELFEKSFSEIVSNLGHWKNGGVLKVNFANKTAYVERGIKLVSERTIDLNALEQNP